MTSTAPSTATRDQGPTAGPGSGRPGSRCSPSSAGPTSASPPWSTGSSAAARRSCRTCPGVTRDRVAYDANWRGRSFTLVDTGGWAAATGPRALAALVAEQAQIAGRPRRTRCCSWWTRVVGVTDADEAVAAVLRRSGKPVVVAANKVDDAPASPRPRRCGPWASASRTWSAPCTAAAAVTCSTLVLGALPRGAARAGFARGGPRRVALIGRPNVGKSSPAEPAGRRAAGAGPRGRGHHQGPGGRADRARRDDLAVRGHRGHQAAVQGDQGADYYAGLRTAVRPGAGRGRRCPDRRQRAARPSRTCASCPWSSTPGRALVLAFNKWDLVDEERRRAAGRRHRAPAATPPGGRPG